MKKALVHTAIVNAALFAVIMLVFAYMESSWSLLGAFAALIWLAGINLVVGTILVIISLRVKKTTSYGISMLMFFLIFIVCWVLITMTGVILLE